jgi:NAD(P)-dependent dehydrogenase (short-subunit alcohol dehydrogenase family)
VIALVTGASRGIGAACAVALSQAGHQVALLGRDSAALSDVASSLSGEFLVLTGDVTDPATVEASYAAVEETWGPVEVLVVNAGAGASSVLAETSDEEWQAMLDLNLTAPFRFIRRALPSMTAAGHGRIVVVASVAAKVGEKRIAPYTAAKHGVLGLVRAAASEVARTGVTVNAVCPGYVDTPMTDANIDLIASRTSQPEAEARALLARKQPIGRLITPEEVAATVMLCVDNGGINGQGLNVDGGAVQS